MKINDFLVPRIDRQTEGAWKKSIDGCVVVDTRYNTTDGDRKLTVVLYIVHGYDGHDSMKGGWSKSKEERKKNPFLSAACADGEMHS